MKISTTGALMFMVELCFEKCFLPSHSFLECLKVFNTNLATCTFAVSKSAEGDYHCWHLAKTWKLTSLHVERQPTARPSDDASPFEHRNKERNDWNSNFYHKEMQIRVCTNTTVKIFQSEMFNHCWTLHDWLNQPLSFLSHGHGDHSCKLLKEYIVHSL